MVCAPWPTCQRGTDSSPSHWPCCSSSSSPLSSKCHSHTKSKQFLIQQQKGENCSSYYLFSIIRCCCSPVSLSSDDPIPPMLPTEKLVEGTNTYKKCMDDYYKSLAPKWGIFGKKFELGKYAHHQTCQQCLTMKGDIISLNQLSPSKIGTSVHIPQRPSLSGGFQYIS